MISFVTWPQTVVPKYYKVANTYENKLCYELLYAIQGDDKVGNLLASGSADIKAFGCTCLFGMLFLIGLALFYTTGVFVNILIFVHTYMLTYIHTYIALVTN